MPSCYPPFHSCRSSHLSLEACVRSSFRVCQCVCFLCLSVSVFVFCVCPSVCLFACVSLSSRLSYSACHLFVCRSVCFSALYFVGSCCLCYAIIRVQIQGADGRSIFMKLFSGTAIARLSSLCFQVSILELQKCSFFL